MAGKRGRIFETKYFGFIIACILFLVFFLLETRTTLFDTLQLKMIDVMFNYKTVFGKEKIQEGVTLERKNPDINEDILIVGIDFKSLTEFGKWPFPRYREADLLDAFSRIKNQGERERALFLDVFFIEPDRIATHDAILVNSIREHGRVFLETVLDEIPPPTAEGDEFFERQEVLYQELGEIFNIRGDWQVVPAYYGLQPPLKPFGRATHGYGHANFIEDDDKVYRLQALVAKSSVLLETIKLEDLTVDVPVDIDSFQRLEWVDKNGKHHPIEYPFTERELQSLRADIESKAPIRQEDTDDDGKPDASYYVVRKYQDHFLPSITLALALEYFNKSLEDIEVVFGKHIFIPHPEMYDVETNTWKTYRKLETPAVLDADGNIVEPAVYTDVNEIKIPIDAQGRLIINFMGLPSFATPGERQTYPIRSFAGYAARPPGADPSKWPRTKAVANKIIMVGPFARGMAADQKPTPVGLMYGVEMHANALNTILMQNFITHIPTLYSYLILFGAILLIAFLTSRLSTPWAFLVTILLVFGFFIGVTILFESSAVVVDFATPAIAMMFSFLTIVVYRVMTEEKDKRRIRQMFGTYVSPKVVDQILENPPELGGVDKHLTVFFSDIRGFTTLSESMTPQDLVNHLNQYLTAMSNIILDFNGTLDKYEGDAIMAFWGAPIPQEDHALLACQASLRQLEALEELNTGWPPEKRINIGIGVNSGIMTVGNMGSLGRMDYTIMGDPVNLGSRLEGTNKEYTTRIIISENTYGLVKDKVIVRELDLIRVKGKSKPVVIYELIDCVDEIVAPLQEA